MATRNTSDSKPMSNKTIPTTSISIAAQHQKRRPITAYTKRSNVIKI